MTIKKIILPILFIKLVCALTTLEPYLQSPTSTSIYISWHLAPETESIVQYGKTISLGQTDTGTTHTFDSETIWHTVKLTNLSPSTVYYYKAITGANESEIKKFKTPPASNNSIDRVRFILYGDTRSRPFQHKIIIDSILAKATEIYGADIEENFNFIFNLGDIVGTGSNLAGYQSEYFSPITSIPGNIPFMVSIGNHEGESPNYFNYMKYENFGGSEGEKYCSFQISKVLFISLNSNIAGNTQILWLDSVLADAEANPEIDWIFTFTHHPGRSEIWPDGNTDWVQTFVIPTLTKYKKVDLLAYGHSHNYERGSVADGNLRLMLNGGGGSALDRWGMYSNQEDYPEIQKSFDHYCYSIFDIDIENKEYTATTYSLGNSSMQIHNRVIDIFSRDKSDATIKPTKPIAAQAVSLDTSTSSMELIASSYTGNKGILSSQFMVTNISGDYSSPSIDTLRDFENIFGYDGSNIDLNFDIDLSRFTVPNTELTLSNKYFWKIRYRDKNLQWSDWSEESSFISGTTTDLLAKSYSDVFKSTLLECFPNPFNPTVKITYSLAKQSNVSISIYNIKGALIKTLLKSSKKAGMHQIKWNGFNASGQKVESGIYFVSTKIGSFIKTQKILLSK